MAQVKQLIVVSPSGQIRNSSLGDTILFPAGTTAGASGHINTGVAPTSPGNGDYWYDGTHYFFRSGGVSVDLLAFLSALPSPIRDNVGGLTGNKSIDYVNKQLFSSNLGPDILVEDYNLLLLIDTNGVNSLNWDNRELLNVGNVSLSWTSQTLRNSNAGGALVAHWGSSTEHFGVNINTTAIAQFNFPPSSAVDVSAPNNGDMWYNGTNFYFFNGSTNIDLLAGGGGSLPDPITDGAGGIGGMISVDWMNRVLGDISGVTSLDYKNRTLNDTAGSSIISWNTLTSYFDFAANSTFQAQATFTPSAAVDVAAPNNGDLWYNGTNLFFFDGAINHDLLGPSFWSRSGLAVVSPATITDKVTIGDVAAQTLFNVVGTGDPIGFGSSFINSVALQDYINFAGVGFGYDSSGQIGIIVSQSSPGNTPSVLNFLTHTGSTFAISLSIDGITQRSTFGGKVQTLAATTSDASINIADSVATDPTSPVTGDLWWNATNLWFYDGAVSHDLLNGGGYVLPSPINDVAGGVTGIKSIDYVSRQLFGSSGNLIFDWETPKLNDTSGILSVNYQARTLLDSGGVQASINYDARLLRISGGGLALDWSDSGVGTALLNLESTFGGLARFTAIVDAPTYTIAGVLPISVTITTAKLTPGGANGSQTFVNGMLTAQTQAT